jgi:hypothetical protein
VQGQRAKSVTGDAVHIPTIKNPAHSPWMQHTLGCGISLNYGNKKEWFRRSGVPTSDSIQTAISLDVSWAINVVDYDANRGQRIPPLQY